MPSIFTGLKRKLLRDGFSIENGRFAKKLVLQSRWKPAIEEFMSDNSIHELEINTGKGYGGKCFEENMSLDFLESLTFLEGLTVIAQPLKNIESVNRLHRLKYLTIDTNCKSEIRFENFPELEECSFTWRPRARSLFNHGTLRRLTVSNYSGKESVEFRALAGLEALSLHGGKLAEIRDLGSLERLSRLHLSHLKALESLNGIENMHRLIELEVETCRKIANIDAVRNLKNLRFLNISNDDLIDSLEPVRNLVNLERLYFYESTNIADGQLEVLQSLPKLEEVRFQNRRHYTLRREIFPPWNE